MHTVGGLGAAGPQRKAGCADEGLTGDPFNQFLPQKNNSQDPERQYMSRSFVPVKWYLIIILLIKCMVLIKGSYYYTIPIFRLGNQGSKRYSAI